MVCKYEISTGWAGFVTPTSLRDGLQRCFKKNPRDIPVSRIVATHAFAVLRVVVNWLHLAGELVGELAGS